MKRSEAELIPIRSSIEAISYSGLTASTFTKLQASIPHAKIFNRFNKFANGSWSIGKDVKIKWDAIILTVVKRDVKIFGIGLYSPYDNKPHNFTLTYKYIIQSSPNGPTITASQEHSDQIVCPPVEQMSNKYFLYTFKSGPIIVNKG